MKKSIAAILFLFFIPLLVFSGTGIDAKYLEKEITFTLNPDGGWQKEYRHRIKLETFLAVSRLCGETFIKYNPRYQELKVLKSETTMKDGKKVASTPNAFNEVLPRDAHNFAHYSHLREMVVTHLGLEREAVIEMHYRLKTKPGFMPYLSAREYIADRFPTERLVLKIWVPDSKKFNYKLFHVDGKPEIKKRGDHTLYTFTFNGVKSFIEEPLNKTFSRSFMVFSTADGWESVFPSLPDVGPLPEGLIKKIDGLKAASASGDDFYFKLQGLVADEIEKCKVGMDLNGFGLRKPGDVFASNYATAIEKAYLFYHILKHFNIPAEITALPIDNQGAKDVPTLLQFDGYLVNIKKKSHAPVFLNPWENGEHLFAYKKGGAAVYNLQQKAFQVLKGYSAEESGVKISGKIDLCTCKKGSGGELTVSLKGHFYPYRSMLKDSKAALMKAVKDVLPVSELEVKKIVLLTPWKVTAVVGVKGKFLKEIYGQRFLLPKFKFPNVKDEIISLTDREYPMPLDVPFYSGVNLEFRVAKGLEVSYLAPSVVIKEGLGLYKQKIELSEEGVIKLQMGLGIKKSLIEPGDYLAFKKVLNKYFIKEPLMVVKKKK